MASKQPSGVTELAKASIHRLDDARALIKARRWQGAMYLAGYAVECLLKTKLMRRYHCDNLSELNDRMHQKRRLADESSLFTHELLRLLDLLQCRYRMQRNADSWRSFNAVNRWLPSWRYSANRGTEKDAIQFMDNVEIVLKWLMANT